MEIFWALVLSAFPLLLTLHILLGDRRRLPPGPPAFPIIGNLLWLRNSVADIEPLVNNLRKKYGDILTLRIGSRPAIFVFDRSLAHKLLVHHGAVLASRPSVLPSLRLLANDQYVINNAPYGPLWRLLRRNLTSEFLHPSRTKLYSEGRDWVKGVLLEKLRAQSEKGDGVVVVREAIHYAMFCLLVLMCFGEKLEEKVVKDVERVQTNFLLYSRKLQVFGFLPKIARYVFAERWRTFNELRRQQTEVFLPLIDARRKRKELTKSPEGGEVRGGFHHCYIDSLLDLEIPEQTGRKLTDEEIISLCSEFFNAGTDTTSTSLEWVMANVVKHQHIQEKMCQEIGDIVGEGNKIEEEEVQKMPYLKAVIMESLRRHPPAHFVLPHAVTKDVVVDGHLIPRDASINFMVAQMGWDEKAWEDPLEFKPERFLPGGEGEGVDITGSKEIKMMPFGVGRRICPGLNLAMLHLEYFTANLVKTFDWKPAVDGEEIDLSEKTQFTVVMKNPLQARVTPRVSLEVQQIISCF